MTKEEIDRLREDLRNKSIRGVTELYVHEQALTAYLDAVVEYIDERSKALA